MKALKIKFEIAKEETYSPEFVSKSKKVANNTKKAGM